MKLRLFLYFVKPYKHLYIPLFVVTVASSMLDALSLAALLPLLSSMIGASAQDQGGIRRFVSGLSQLVPVGDPIIATSLVLVFVFCARASFGVMREALTAHASGRVLCDIKNRIVDGYSKRTYQFFLDNKIGNLIYRAVVAPSYITTFMRRIPQMAAETLRGVSILVVLLVVFPFGVLVIGTMGLVYYQVIRYLSRKVSYDVGREKKEIHAEEHVVAGELVTGIRQMLIFCTAGRWVDLFKKKNRRYTYLWTKDLIWLAVPKQVMEFSALLVVLGLVFALRYQSGGNLAAALPELGIFVAGLMQLLPTVTELGRMRMEVVGILPEIEAIQACLDEPLPPTRQGGRPFAGLNKGIIFKDVHFAHVGREPLLRGLNLVFERGQVTALVGSSGAGKSTIVNLLLGLYEPTAGQILLDDLPLSKYNLDTWRRAIGFVSQDPFLIHGTVRDNITFGRQGFSEDDVLAAARLANADSFIRELPDGFDTVVGERGMKLSGGQQQRLCIARALLSDPPLLLFDEATSSLDSVTERAIQETIRDISRGHTVIQIAHRASTVARADQIVVLHHGLIVESGSHSDLLQSDGEYAKLFTVD